MQSDIKNKLAKELNEPINSERQVVYILVELRKLMELTGNTGGDYFALNFYCDWAVHPKLSWAGAVNIVKRFDKYQAFNELLNQSTDDVLTVPVDEFRLLEELDGTIQLAKFRTQLGTYLEKEGLPHTIARDPKQWINFLSYYFRVIEDSPLLCEAQLPHVQQVKVKVLDVKTEVDAELAGYRIMVDWRWQPNNQQLPEANRVATY